MQNRLTFVFVFLTFLSYGQTKTLSLSSGPFSWKAFGYSANVAGPGWYTASYNDSAWVPPYNGSGADAGVSQGTCAAPNTSGWGGDDTIIWSRALAFEPDTACFRRTFDVPKCATVTNASFSVGADDYYNFYINDNFVGTNITTIGTGMVYMLDSTQLQWINQGNNVLAAEVINRAPTCSEFVLLGSVTMDTVGCYRSSGITQVTNYNEIKISPNPTTNNIIISTAEINAPYTFDLYEILGSKILSQTSATAHTKIDISGLAKGVYILQSVDKYGKISTQKVAKE